MKYASLIEHAKKIGCLVKKNEILAKYTSFKIGGKADVLINVTNKSSLVNVLKILKKENIPYFLMGSGCNLLIHDEGVRGVVLKLSGEFSKIELLENNIIVCGSSSKLSKVCNFALKNSLSGLEFAWGIPASIGGAIYMNAGAYGGEIKDVLFACEHIDENLEHIYKEGLSGFSYRKSFYTNTKSVIMRAYFKLLPSPQDEIKEKMDDYIKRRKAKQPLEFPNAGSIFKRPQGHFVGELIDECGLRGKKIGGAKVSSKHGGFIVNENNSTCEDVVNLIKFIQNKVYSQKGIKLEPEIRTLGNIDL